MIFNPYTNDEWTLRAKQEDYQHNIDFIHETIEGDNNVGNALPNHPKDALHQDGEWVL